MKRAMTKEEKERFEAAFIQVMQKRRALIKAGRKERSEARKAALAKAAK
jgi:hypothetical protein